MTRSIPPRRPVTRLGFLLCAGLALAGCTGSPPSRYYLLAPLPAPAAEQGALPAAPRRDRTVVVGPVEIARYLDRPEITVRTGPNEVHPLPDALWAEPLKALIPRVLVRDLGTLLPAVRVERFPRTGAGAPHVTVRLRVDRFDADLAGRAVLEGCWTVIDRHGSPVARAFRFEETAADPQDTAALVRALNAALEALAQTLAGSVRSTLPPEGDVEEG